MDSGPSHSREPLQPRALSLERGVTPVPITAVNMFGPDFGPISDPNEPTQPRLVACLPRSWWPRNCVTERASDAFGGPLVSAEGGQMPW
jgi:hypothetical protein